ncbi:SANT/Myb_domain [Hexamita inflata]|uniref:SANT/Myb domain n=1 Tax=Hexamita inflata TaxID=28002 RepID=A0AA86PKA2_9EUKA|nr:SANT/Myb domain [Hexamita inflata]
MSCKRWSESENKQFLFLLSVYQKDFEYIAQQMNKTYNQVRSHFYNIQSKDRYKSSKNDTSPMKKLRLIAFDVDFE